MHHVAQTLSDIKGLLAAHGLSPKKRFGQNFLHDGNHMAKIMDAAALRAGDLVLEVGPGTGALTERLLDAGARVVAVEIDADLAPILDARLGHDERFTLHIGDALDGKHAINPTVLALLGDAPHKLIANLPYNVASPLLINLALDHPAMTGAVVMVQREVADRIVAGPAHGKAYGPLGIILQTVFETDRVCVLSPGCFYPPPSIASAVVKLVRRPTPLCADPPGFAAFVHALFGKRRKQIGAILGPEVVLPGWLDRRTRPEALTVEQLVGLGGLIDWVPGAD